MIFIHSILQHKYTVGPVLFTYTMLYQFTNQTEKYGLWFLNANSMHYGIQDFIRSKSFHNAA